MLIEQVKELSPLARFFYWIRERHNIYLKRRAGKPKPWTDDEVLRNWFFTNPYRENDKTTIWFRENVREPLRDDPRVFFATVCFRWFNLIETAGVLTNENPWDSKHNLLTHWDCKEAISRLDGVRRTGGKVFTGAYMINSPGGEPKLEAICRCITNVWKERYQFTDGAWCEEVTMEGMHQALLQFDRLGGFMAYEIVTDLRHTYLLENAPDKMTWCHVGPGATRGLYRVLQLKFKKGDNASSPPRLKNDLDEMGRLLKAVQKALPKMPPFEMREIEHSLCEYDKYSRALEGDGKMKRTYRGG